MNCFKLCLVGTAAIALSCHMGKPDNTQPKNLPVITMPATPAIGHGDSVVRKIVMFDTEALRVIDTAAPIEVIAQGYKWAEGPVYVKDGDYLLFSDIPNNNIYKWQWAKGASLYLTPSGHTGPEKKEVEPGSNGLALNAHGNLLLCQHGDRRIARMDAPLTAPKPAFVTLAGRYKGKRLNSPNDLVLHPNGDLYFTDPPYGLDKRLADTAKDLDFQGVYRLKPNGQLDLVTNELKLPNGIALSPDGKVLYVSNSDSTNMLWMRYELDANGLIKSKRVFYHAKAYDGSSAGNPDGIKVNSRGYVFAAGPEGIWVFNPQGTLLARMYTGAKTANCAFAPGEKKLFIASGTKMLMVNLK